MIFPKAASLSGVRAYVLEKIQDGPESLGGLFNTLQGRLGEFQFKKLANGMADLPTKTNQEGWDVVSRASGEPRYIQVKVYNDAQGALEKVREVEEKLKAGLIEGENGELVSNIDFAVNSEIYQELKEKIEAEGLATKVLDLGASREAIRGRLEVMANEVDHTLEDFFLDILGGVVAAGALHAIVNGFLVYNRAKAWNQAVEDSIYSSTVSGVGIATAATTEYIIANYITFIGGPMMAVAVLGAGISARSIARRIGDRRHFAKWLSEDNRRLQGYVLKFARARAA